VNEYTRVDANFNYYSSIQPDSAFVIITSSIDGFNPYPGSTLLIDKLSLIFSVGIADEAYLPEVYAYPNPVNDVLVVSNNKAKLLKVRVTSLLGEILYEEACDRDNLKISMQHFTSGIYMVEMITTNGSTTQKIIKN
jgi:hypothetical protein